MAGKTEQLKTVTLLKPHEHAGKQYRAGDQVDVDAATAAWLEQHNVTGSDRSAKTEEDKS